MAWSPVPLKVTVPCPGVNVPPLFVQLPDTLKAPLGAVSVPLERITLVTSTSPLEPVNVPPEMVSPPLKVWVAVPAK